MKNTQVLLRNRPTGEPSENDFEVVETETPRPGRGQVLIRAHFLSLDPYMRGRMSDAKSYAKPVAIGDVMEGATVGEVVESNDPRFAKGDLVAGGKGWQRFCVADGDALRKVDTGIAPLSAYTGVLGMPGLTAWVGLEDIGQPKPGETVVVSAASGAVGQVVGQIAKARGARVIGVAGGKAKGDFVVRELGFDACLDHRGDLDAQLDKACPEGIDVYWENVGGKTQHAVFPRFRDFGRMVMCGMISQYNTAPGADTSKAEPGPNLGAVVRKRLRIQGFIVFDTGWQRYGRFLAEMDGLIRAGQLKWKEDVVEGLERAPRAFIGLLRGENFGKLVVKI
ncbi:NADP-dependent oxidoreductase [Sabulicella rubraurantiaca]|uniref:NADP-dependent oxidoreductase n=1 Tax=Sabulicella rubraurantiaca TaxID=2811429 RepID=UPI001A959619|nr:NADP-dependent oxidoreductase [Sabulicella rubraurantiaca]